MVKLKHETGDHYLNWCALVENGALTSQQFQKKKLKQINMDNARKWLDREKTQHSEEGDENTKYFHIVANGRRRWNTVQKLIINGEDNFNQQDIKIEISNYFFNLFQENHTMIPQMNP